MSATATVWMDPAVRRAIVAHARRERPRECCGLLVGAGRRIAFAVPMRNVAAGRVRYALDPAAHITLRRALRSFAPRLEIIGVYHSHPAGEAWPSPSDVRDAHYREWIHVIVGLGARTARVRAFRIVDARIRTLAVASGRPPGRAV